MKAAEAPFDHYFRAKRTKFMAPACVPAVSYENLSPVIKSIHHLHSATCYSCGRGECSLIDRASFGNCHFDAGHV
ncbi:hypothetical protein PGTUg99_033834 [Puccinia graminis f. sp. tritici]|uniref:Uncharacterized protein n=1 Tax=Puccinia graminis f. sp. tritici TaxID=56615 RepID=A0A5B0P5M8_PUCGR|nr:hypothetical protein PGTUg99_033834 [Puccinia graminis f. sp. tritici]